MQTTDRISISPLDGPDSDRLAESRVLIDGRERATVVSGSCFEAAVEGDGFYLLFMTNGNPFEDFLHIHMLDRQGVAVDSCSLGAPYSTGAFSLQRLNGVRDAPGLSFRFIGGIVWQLEVFPRRRFRWPLVSEPFGVWRTHSFHFNFRLKGKPLPETRSH